MDRYLGVLAAAWVGLGLLLQGTAPALAQEQRIRRPIVHEPVTPQVFIGDLRELPRTRVWQPGDSVRDFPDLNLGEPGQGQVPEFVPGSVASAPPGPGTAGPASTLAFDGIPATGWRPPDPVGDVGKDHYIQMVNISLAIYDKDGNLLAGPVAINALWSGFGGPCESQNSGDPIVRYDHLADRWLVSQFAIAFDKECIAISRSSDPVAGGWYLYEFDTPGNPDYPKIGVWPDGYYMGTQRGYFTGNLDVYVFDRIKMLNGQPAGSVEFLESSLTRSIFLLPSDLDGPPPPAGTPNFFVRQVDGGSLGGVDRLEVFAFVVNWENPAASSFTQLPDLPTAAFDPVLCGASLDLMQNCVPQPGTGTLLETLTPWPMWRLQFRNFGTHETLVFNHTVDADGSGHAGIRWYELRRAPGGAWVIFQQGTHSPDLGAPGLADDLHRWMGSIAMDADGSIALGYSASSGTVFPSIMYTGRVATDPSGSLPVPEGTLVAGGGSQLNSARWGNYSTLDVDPVDGCTFWYTNEYYPVTSAAGWRTRVASFRMPSCIPPELRPLPHEVAFFIGGLITDDDLPLNSGFYTGFRYRRHRILPNFSWEIETGLTATDDGAQDGKLYSVQAHLVGHLNSLPAKVLPFALIGIGVDHYNTLGSSDTSPLVTLGIGADYHWIRRVSFRFDARVVWLNDMIDSGWTANGQLLWGTTFSF